VLFVKDMEHVTVYVYFIDPGQVSDFTMLFSSGPYSNDFLRSIQSMTELKTNYITGKAVLQDSVEVKEAGYV